MDAWLNDNTHDQPYPQFPQLNAHGHKHITVRETCVYSMCRTKLYHCTEVSFKNVPGHLIPHAWKSFLDIPTPSATTNKGQGWLLCWRSNINICSQIDNPPPPSHTPQTSITHSCSPLTQIGGRALGQTHYHICNEHTIKNMQPPQTPFTISFAFPQISSHIISILMQTQLKQFPPELRVTEDINTSVCVNYIAHLNTSIVCPDFKF